MPPCANECGRDSKAWQWLPKYNRYIKYRNCARNEALLHKYKITCIQEKFLREWQDDRCAVC